MVVVLGVSLALAAFLAVNAAASLVVALVWRAAERDPDGVRPASRAAGLFLLRILPATAALVFVLGVFLPAFCAFEPRGDTGEAPGPGLLGLAALASGLILRGAWLGWQAWRATGRLVRRWLNEATPVQIAGIRVRAYSIPAEFPIVSVVGILRPRLFVSERVLEACALEELSAMVRHESRHLMSRDNLRQLLLRACPDPLSLMRVGRDMEERWRDASEEAADDYTVRASAPSALALADALLKVARMAPAEPVALPVLSAVYRGGSIERRVRRLLGGGPAGSTRPGWLLAARALALVPPFLALVVLLDPDLLRGVHRVIEAVVEILP